MNKMMLIIVIVAVVLIGGFLFINSMNKDGGMMGMNDKTSMMADENSEGVMVGGAMMTPDKDIVDNAVNSDDHTTLVAAVQAAGLVDTLKGAGPFTVFAPTNAAFDKLPAGTVDTLLLPENKDQLTGVLTYHVIPGAYRASDLTDGMTLETVNGQTVTFTERDGQWYINDAAITIADVISSNGVTHVVDTVLLPQ